MQTTQTSCETDLAWLERPRFAGLPTALHSLGHPSLLDEADRTPYDPKRQFFVPSIF